MPEERDQRVNRVVVTNVDIQFGTMVWLMVKASFAAAIAALITSFLWALVGVILVGLMALGLWLLGMAFLALGFGSAMMLGPATSPPHTPPAPTEIVVPIESPPTPPPASAPPPSTPRAPAPRGSGSRPTSPDLQTQQRLGGAALESCQTWGPDSAECMAANNAFNAYQRSVGEEEYDYAAYARAVAEARVAEPTMVASSFETLTEHLNATQPERTDPLVSQRETLAFYEQTYCTNDPTGAKCERARGKLAEFDRTHPELAAK